MYGRVLATSHHTNRSKAAGDLSRDRGTLEVTSSPGSLSSFGALLVDRDSFVTGTLACMQEREISIAYSVSFPSRIDCGHSAS